MRVQGVRGEDDGRRGGRGGGLGAAGAEKFPLYFTIGKNPKIRKSRFQGGRNSRGSGEGRRYPLSSRRSLKKINNAWMALNLESFGDNCSIG